MAALDERDKLATTHRNHGHVLARGADPGRAMAEILGRATGLIGGRGGTIHLSEPDLGFISTSGIVGGCISLGVGAGYACKQRGDGSVSVPFFGDGALEEGVSFEALNIASLWRLPVRVHVREQFDRLVGAGRGLSDPGACLDRPRQHRPLGRHRDGARSTAPMRRRSTTRPAMRSRAAAPATGRCSSRR